MGFITTLYIILFFFGIFFLLIFILMQYRNSKALYDYPKPKRYPTVSFLVPAYNEEKSIADTINALLNIKYPKGKKEIIVINDGSKDRTAEIVRKLEKKYKEIYLLNKKNSGKANSLNQAIKLAKGELIAVVDADSYPNKNALIRMVGYFEDENVGAVTSRVLVKNKKNWIERYQVLDYSIIAWTRKLLDFVNSVYVTNGPLSIYRKDIVVEIGGFDPKNLTEDIEITWNILSHDYDTRMSYSAIVYTIVPSDFKMWVKQRVRWNLGGLQTIYKYWRHMFRRREFGYFVIPYVAASFMFAIIGFLLILRYAWIKGSYYYYSIYYYFLGYDFFRYIEFNFTLTLLFFFAMTFLVFAIYYYKTGFKHSETGRKSVLKILAYSFFYRSLYIVPLLIAWYKLARGDIRWYTK
ncbi:MAG: glycosyltransferase family 2 protein [Nanoarchaeota archaeon]|nr:glycosyltransferase family 2 protein [Nanoarchaeota archaeon]